MAREKSKLEKLFSFKRYKRRFGAKELSSMISTDFDSQINNIISVDEKVYTHGSSDNIEEHFKVLKNEFAGESELCYTHAKIIVLIRREFEQEKHYKIFEALWNEQKEFLLKNLNTRWLISATDTFTDYSENDITKALAFTSSCLINTIKLHETEKFLTKTLDVSDNYEQKEILQTKRVALFDGTSAFAVGTDDTLRNMRWRLNKISKINVAGEILLEIFNRLQVNETVYKRFKDRHTRERTGWW